MAWTDLNIPPAPVLNAVGTGAAARQLSAAGSRSVVPLVYGEDRLAGLVLNVLPAAAGSATLLVQLLWCFACDSVSALKLNDQDLPTGSSVTHYTGSQTTPDAALVAAFASQGITYTAALTGYAYSVVSMPIRSIGSAEFNFGAIIRGRKVYDPRKDSTAGGSGAHRLASSSTWEWSPNPALCLADYSSSTVYGAGTPIDWSSVPAAANACDAVIIIEPSRIVGLSFVKAVEVNEAIETLRAYASCWVLPGVNGVRLVPDAPAASVAAYSHAGGDIAAIQPLALRDTSRAPTAVEVIYTDRSKLPWRDASAIAALPGAGTTKPWRLSQVRLPGVARYSQAIREANERLNKLTLCDLSTSVEIYDIGLRHEIGDVILLSHPIGLDSKPFRIRAVRRVGAGRWVLDVVEYDAAVYAGGVVAAPSVADTSWVSPAGPPSAVTGFTAVPDELGILLRWAPNPEKDVTGYELRVGGTSWETALPLDGGVKTVAAGNSYRWLQPDSGTYTLRIKALDSEGLDSASATVLTPTVTSTKLAGIQAGATAGAVWGVNIGGQPSDAAILNANLGGVNFLWGAGVGPWAAGPADPDKVVWFKIDAINPFGLLPGESLSVSADVWQDAAAAAAGQVAAVVLWAQRADGVWTVSASAWSGGQAPVRASGTLSLPAAAADMARVGVALIHPGQGGRIGVIRADRIKVERGGSASQFTPGAQPGATANRTIRQSADPSPVEDGAIWISDTKSYQRLGGQWLPYVGPGSVGTGEIVDGAATQIAQVEVASFSASAPVASLNFFTVAQLVITPEAASKAIFTITSPYELNIASNTWDLESTLSVTRVSDGSAVTSQTRLERRQIGAGTAAGIVSRSFYGVNLSAGVAYRVSLGIRFPANSGNAFDPAAVVNLSNIQVLVELIKR